MVRARIHWALLCTAALLAALPAHGKTRSRGEIDLSGRAFWPDDDDRTEDFGAAVAARLELQAKQKGGFRQQLRVFGRAGGIDPDRSIATVEEAWVGWKKSRLELQLGAQMLNWTATEAFHPADIMNSRNLDSDIENAEKLGEPMVSFRVRFLEGGVTAYFMPTRIAPRFPGPSSRLSLTQGQSIGDALWAGRDGEIGDDLFAPQWAARLDQTFGSADLALHYVEHNDRSQPAIAVQASDMQVRPVFPTVRRAGLTYTQAIGEWLVKVEADHRMFFDVDGSADYIIVAPPAVDHTSVALGLEWGWGYDDGGEGTVLLEGQAAIAPDASEAEFQALGPFQRDVLLGYRHAFNDVDGTELLAGVIADTERFPEVLVNFVYSQRLSDVWGISGTLRVIHAPEEESFLHAQHEAHSVQLDLTRYF